MNSRYRDWFAIVVWIGVLGNWTFAFFALFVDPHAVLSTLKLGGVESTVWLYNYCWLLVILSCFYIPAAVDPVRYRANAYLLVVGRLVPSATFFIGVGFGFMPEGFLYLGIADGAIGLIELILVVLIFRDQPRRGYQRSLISRAIAGMFVAINAVVPWHRLPRYLGVFNLWSFRNDLREFNLHDTAHIPAQNEPPLPAPDPSNAYARSADGTYTDSKEPEMGRAMSRFGRNVPLEMAWPDREPALMSPSPREVSRRLMTRDFFKPAESLNVLAAAWIQFQNHGWFNHIRDEEETIEIPLERGDDWHEDPMWFQKTKADETRGDDSSSYPPTFLSDQSHWWDASQIYGSSRERQHLLRTFQDGKMRVDEDNPRLLPPEVNPKLGGIDLTGFNDNWWTGIGLLHTMFVHEHNSICDALRREYTSWSDDRLFATARQINAALMAKIHTVEWTPGILSHPALQIAMSANWWGLIGERLRKQLGRIGDGEAFSGVPGSPLAHHGAPYYLTEEFVAVYRLHPLIPDDYKIFSSTNGRVLDETSFTDIQGSSTRGVLNHYGVDDVLYSLGVEHPGAIVLHNFPRTLQDFERIDGKRLDLAAVDVMRDRERGVPRYNDFREALRMPRLRSFDKISSNPKWCEEIRDVYEGDIDRVDLSIGMLAEPLPRGFGFSDTAFRIFILMATRRLKSDRFFTTDWKPEVYTPIGMEWLNNYGMKDVLHRHYPEITPAIQDVANAFAPWKRIR